MDTSVRVAAADLVAASDDGRLETLCTSQEIGLLVLFGSAADPDVDEPGDLDIAVLPRSPSTFDPIRCRTALVDLVHMDRIDLVNLSTAGVLVRSQALGSGVPLYEDRAGTYAAEQFRSVPLAMELGWLTDLELRLLASR